MVIWRERVEPRIHQTPGGCLMWLGSLSEVGGYPQLNATVDGVKYYFRVHRLSQFLFNGTLTPGLEVQHECDVSACVAPGHLTEGTHRKNMSDAAKRGRSYSVLTRPLVFEIKQRLRDGTGSQREIARSCGVSQQTISRIKTGENWKHVKLP